VRFLDAARRWDAATVTQALRAERSLAFVTDRNGRTALHLCAASSAGKAARPASASVATARALLAAGVPIDAVHEIADGGERFPARALWHAIARGKNRSLTRFLLREGANPDYCYWAVVWNDDVALARLLHTHGADLNLTFHGETPLLYATRLRRTRMMKWLLRHGANANLADGEGRTPLAVAVRRRYPFAELADLLEHGADPLSPAVDGSTPRSLVSRRTPRVAQLLDRYVPVATP
jgi:ankyrin repeat protein